MANRLANRGHEVMITSLGLPRHHWFPLDRKVKIIYPELRYSISVLGRRILIRKLGDQLLRKVRLPYNIDPIRLLASSIPHDVDINVATFCFTAYAVYRSNKGHPFYYIQHYEPLFFRSDPYLYKMAEETYYLPLRKFVVSKWLENLIKNKTKEEPIYLGNGVNTEIFYPRPVSKDGKDKIIMAIFRGIEWKGEKEILEALNIVHKKFQT
jgi:hypothetical protein